MHTRKLALASLLILLQFSSERSAAADGVEMKREFVYEEAPNPECHASTIVETPSGLVAAWFGGSYEKHPDVGVWVSRKTAEGWTSPVEVVNGVQTQTLRYPCWNPVLFQYPKGPLTLFYKVGPNPVEWWGMYVTSTDHGKTWSVPEKLPPMILGPIKNKPILLDNGDLLCGSSTEHEGWRVHFEISRHENKSWEKIGPIESADRFNAIQPGFIVHKSKDGKSPAKIQAFCRSREGNIVTTSSTDGGHTWTPLERTSLPNPSSGTDSVTLADGRHLLIYNHTKKGRSPLNLAISTDGINWNAAHVFESEPGEYSYPAIIQTSDGLVHATYTWKRKKVRHVVLDPAKIKDAPAIVDGVWPESVNK